MLEQMKTSPDLIKFQSLILMILCFVYSVVHVLVPKVDEVIIAAKSVSLLIKEPF